MSHALPLYSIWGFAESCRFFNRTASIFLLDGYDRIIYVKNAMKKMMIDEIWEKEEVLNII